MPKAIPPSEITQAIQRLQAVRDDWLRRPGVTAVDVSRRIVNGRTTEELALCVHVRRKLPAEELPDDQVFNVSGGPPNRVGEFPIDVIEVTYDLDQHVVGASDVQPGSVDRTARFPTLVGGISVGNPRVNSAGTLGAIVWDRRDGSANLLSAWHVLAGDRSSTLGEPIYQPSWRHGGVPRDTVARLGRSRLDGDMDAALARLDGSRPYDPDVIGVGPIAGVEEPAMDMVVVKSGVATGHTEGVIAGLAFTPTFTVDGQPVTFYDQIRIHPRTGGEVSGREDSGAIWVDLASNRAVGLHFCGEVGAGRSEHAGATPMNRVAAPSGLDFSFSPLA